MKLDQHIYSLLQTNNCVIVPQFGGFLANYRPAKLYPHRHVVYPPGKSIAFNSSLSSNDGLLVNAISCNSQSSYREAENVVTEAVNDWQLRLDEGKPVEISRIGSITRSQEGKLLFKPEADNDLLLSSFGLGAIQALPLKKEKPVKIIPLEQPMIQPASSRSKKRFTGMSVVAALLFVLVMINASFLYVIDENYKQTLAGIVPAFKGFKEQVFSVDDKKQPVATVPAENQKEAVTAIMPAEEETVDTTSILHELEAPVTSPAEEAPTEKTSQKNTSAAAAGVTHYIIGGSFKDLENAEKLANKVKNSGYTPEIMSTNIGYYRVCYAKFKAEETANSELEKIKLNINQNAWILSE